MSLASIIDDAHSAIREAKKVKEEADAQENQNNTNALRSLSDEKKRARAYEMKLQGIPVTAIANIFGVSPSTVRSWLQIHASEFTGVIEASPAANIIAESLLFYENLEALCLAEIRDLKGEKDFKDAKTGQIITEVDYDAKNLKQKYIGSLMQIRKQSLDLMQTTGIIPKEPERLYHTMEREKPIDSKEQLNKNEGRSKDELIDEVLRMVAKGRHLK